MHTSRMQVMCTRGIAYYLECTAAVSHSRVRPRGKNKTPGARYCWSRRAAVPCARSREHTCGMLIHNKKLRTSAALLARARARRGGGGGSGEVAAHLMRSENAAARLAGEDAIASVRASSRSRKGAGTVKTCGPRTAGRCLLDKKKRQENDPRREILRDFRSGSP